MSSVANKLTAFVIERWQIYTNTEQMHGNMEFNYIYTVYYVFAFEKWRNDWPYCRMDVIFLK